MYIYEHFILLQGKKSIMQACMQRKLAKHLAVLGSINLHYIKKHSKGL